jgi:hypothetical protein
MSGTELTLILALVGIGISVWSAYLSHRKNSNEYVNRKVDWEVKQESRIAKLEQDIIRMTPVNDRVVALETQMIPLWKIVEDSVLKGVMHNPLTSTELQALHEYWHHKDDPNWYDVEVLEIGKRGLQRELKQLEDDPSATTESTLPYVLTIAAIDRRLALARTS